MQDACVQAALLRHSSILNNPHSVAALQRTSKVLQAALAELAAGQLCLRLYHIKPHHAEAFAQWLQKHAGLLRELQLFCCPCCAAVSATALQALEAGLQKVAAGGSLQLQSFSLLSSPVDGQGFLQHLPAMHLTHLAAAVNLANPDSMQAVAALTGLRRLELTGESATAAGHDAYRQLAGLQQLTELHMHAVKPAQLLCLPSHLQQLHITVAVDNLEQLTQLAGWLAQDTGYVRSLGIQAPLNTLDVWVSASAAFAASLEEAAKELAAGSAPAAAGAAGAAAAAAGPLRNLQSHSWACRSLGSAGALLKCLPASSLTHLYCSLELGNTADIAALCRLTGLLKLALHSTGLGPGFTQPAGNWLAQLSALPQLTHLEIASGIPRSQLQHLQLPQLQLLRAHITGTQGLNSNALQLGHLASVRTLILSTGHSERILRPDDTLPPNVLRLGLSGSAGRIGESRSTSCNWEPLQLLRKLEHLDAKIWPGEPKETGKLSTLCRLSSLSSVSLSYKCYTCGGAGSDGAAAWRTLPIETLCFYASEYGKALVQQLGKLQGLQQLTLTGGPHQGEVKATLEQLAAALQQLRDLRMLRIERLTSIAGAKAQEGSEDAYHDAESAVAVLQAIGGMRKLMVLHVELPVRLELAAVQQLTCKLGHLLPSWMVQYCKVQGDKLSVTL